MGLSGDYDGQHQALRKALLPQAWGSPCSRCGRPMHEWQQLDLDHTDDRADYRGFSHARCNRRAGGRVGAARRRVNQRRRRAKVFSNAVLGVQISQDRAHTSVVVAGPLEGDVIGVEMVSYLAGTTTAVEEILRVRAEREVRAVVVDPRSPASTLIKPLREAGVEVIEPSTSDLAVAHGGLLDLLAAGKLRVASHPALDAAARHGTQRPLSGASTWERRTAAVDIAPLDAAQLAAWAVVHRQAPFFGGRWAE